MHYDHDSAMMRGSMGKNHVKFERRRRDAPMQQMRPVPVLLAALIGALAPAGALRAQDPGSAGERARLPVELERIREATKGFHDITTAHAAGYPAGAPTCLENPPHGGMGHHYAHPELMDDELDVERPEILVYAPAKNGGLELAGVEYIVPYSVWPRQDAPRILGHDLKRSDQLQLWYLHVWVWKENSNGMFADWNPAVHCTPLG
jgi:hypothetical protein